MKNAEHGAGHARTVSAQFTVDFIPLSSLLDLKQAVLVLSEGEGSGAGREVARISATSLGCPQGTAGAGLAGSGSCGA